MFGAEPYSSALRMQNATSYKYDWYWHKTRKTNFPNAKRQPLRNVECVSVFYEGQGTYNPQGLLEVNKAAARAKPSRETVNAGENDGSLCGAYTQTHTGYPSQLLRVASVGKCEHPTQKPVELLRYLVRTHTHPGELVLDFAMGSGTTGAACLAEGRRFIGIETDRHFYELAAARLGVAP